MICFYNMRINYMMSQMLHQNIHVALFLPVILHTEGDKQNTVRSEDKQQS